MVSKGDLTRLSVILCPLFLAALFITLIPHSFALEQNGVIQMPFTDSPPVIDGWWTTSDEWKDASRTTMTDEKKNIAFIYAEHDRDYLYIMIDMVNDQTKPSPDPNGYGEGVSINFDTENSDSPQVNGNDYIFDLGYDRVTLGKEFRLGVYTSGVPPMFTWIDLPSGSEGNSGFSSTNDPNESGRNHEIYEMKIPLSFLHKQDKFGFMVLPSDTSSHTHMSWPSGAGWTQPNSWGTLVAPNQSITAPPVPVISISTNSLSFGNEEVSGKSSQQSITITNSGTGTLKISNIQTPNEFSVSGINTPVDVPPNQSVTVNVILAPISIGEKSGQITIYSNDLSNPASSISVTGTGVEKAKSPFGGKCLIATAAFGSELSPQVQFLRDFRDSHILQTKDGSSFMNAFNAWYYSFSPYVADYERGQPWMQQIVRGAIYPLLGILTASEKAYSILPGEYGSMSAGLVASSLIGAVYFWPFALAAPQVRKGNRLNYKLAAISFAVVSTATVFSIIVGNEIAMMVTTSLFVLTLVGIFATISAKTIVRAVKKFI